MESSGDSGAEVGAVSAEAVSEVSGEIAEQIPAFGTTIVNRAARDLNRTIKTVVFNARSGALRRNPCMSAPATAGGGGRDHAVRGRLAIEAIVRS